MLDGNPNASSKKIQKNIKILLIGDSDSGSRSLLTRFLYDSFFDKSLYGSNKKFSLIGSIIEPTQKFIDVGNFECQLQILRNKDLTNLKGRSSSTLYVAPQVMMICCDFTKSNSLDWIGDSIQSIRESSIIENETQIIVVATKYDLIKQRAITTEQAQEYCAKHEFDYIETSSKNFFQVYEAFQLASMHALESMYRLDDFDDGKISNALDLDRYKPEKKALHNLCNENNNCNNTILLIGDKNEKENFIKALTNVEFDKHNRKNQLSIRINDNLFHIIVHHSFSSDYVKLEEHGKLINDPEHPHAFMNLSTQAAAYIYIGATDAMKNTFENIRMINICYVNTIALDFDKIGVGAKQCMEVIYPTLKEQQSYFKHNQMLMIMAHLHDKRSFFSLLPKDVIMEICNNAHSLVKTSTICTSVPKKILEDKTALNFTQQLEYLLDDKVIGVLLKRNVSIARFKSGFFGEQVNLYDYLQNMINSSYVEQNKKAQEIIFCLKNHNFEELETHLKKTTIRYDPTTTTGMKIWTALKKESDFTQITSGLKKNLT